MRFAKGGRAGRDELGPDVRTGLATVVYATVSGVLVLILAGAWHPEQGPLGLLPRLLGPVSGDVSAAWSWGIVVRPVHDLVSLALGVSIGAAVAGIVVRFVPEGPVRSALLLRWLLPAPKRAQDLDGVVAGVRWHWSMKDINLGPVPFCPEHGALLRYWWGTYEGDEGEVRDLRPTDAIYSDAQVESGLWCAAVEPPHVLRDVRWRHTYEVERRNAADWLLARASF